MKARIKMRTRVLESTAVYKYCIRYGSVHVATPRIRLPAFTLKNLQFFSRSATGSRALLPLRTGLSTINDLPPTTSSTQVDNRIAHRQQFYPIMRLGDAVLQLLFLLR